jgi:signal transduction histidine kinase
MRLTRSTRARTVAVQVGLLLVALVVSVLVSRQVLLVQLDQRIDRELADEEAELRQLAGSGVDPSTGRPFDSVEPLMRTQLERTVPGRYETFFSVVDGVVVARSSDSPPVRLDADPEFVAAVASTTSPTLGTFGTSAGQVRYAAIPVVLAGEPSTRGVYVVAVFRDEEARDTDDAVLVLAVVGGAAAVLTGVLAWVLIGRVLRPLRDLAATSRRVDDRDMSERVEVRGQDDLSEVGRTFNDMLDRLEAAFVEQRRFADDAGHELRTPITIVRGHTELLSDDPEVRERQRALVLDELDRMGRMVDDLLVLTRSGQPDFVRREPTALDELGPELWDKAQALAPRAWVLESTASGAAMLDRQRLTQAMLQLAQNAVQHTRDGDRIVIGVDQHGEQVRLWVHDSGPGVPAADREAVFDRFARGGSGEREGPGAGLGLAIVRAIARAHGGDAAFEDPPDGIGAMAVLTLPMESR